jgi:hypothetical protein
MVLRSVLYWERFMSEERFIKYTLLAALAYFGGHVLYYIGLELSCYLYGVLQ